MKLTSSILASIVPFAMCVSVICVKMPTLADQYETEAQIPITGVHAGPPQACANPRNAVPLLRAWNPKIKDHFYTANENELKNATSRPGYVDEGITGYIFTKQEPQTVPLYRLYQNCQHDHFYTVNKAESGNAVEKYGYTYEGIAGYVYPPSPATPPPETSLCGGLPLYRLYSATGVDHFYTMSVGERDSAAGIGYSKEGIAAYLLPF